MADTTTTILAGGQMLPITHTDGTKEEIKVRQLPIRLLESYDAKQMDEPALVELYCDKESGWADSLTHESYEEIATLGDEIDRAPFERLRARLVARVGMVKEQRTALEDAGVISRRVPRATDGTFDPLVQPEVKRAPAVAVVAEPEPKATDSPSPKSSENSLPVDSSLPTSGH